MHAGQTDLEQGPDLGDLLTHSAREGAEAAAAAGAGFFFDFRGPTFKSPQAAALLPGIIDPLLHAAVRRPRTGFVFFSVDVLAHQSGSATVTMQITCAADRQLGGAHEGPAPVSTEVLADIRKQCAALSGDLAVGAIAEEGYVVRADVLLHCPPRPIDITIADPHDHTAWLVGEPPVVFESIERRLHRLGWATEVFRSVEDAAGAIGQTGQAFPSVVIAQERYGVSLEGLSSLGDQLPGHVRLFMGTSAPPATRPAQTGRVVLTPLPFSPQELHRLTEEAVSSLDGTLTARSRNAALSSRPLALVADDNLINQILSTEVLHMLGFEVDVANNGQEALDHCLQRAPDVVLMDIDMPVMDGVQATRTLRALEKDGRLPHIPILAVTARTDDGVRAATAAAGVDSFVAKPIDIVFLQTELRRLIPVRAERAGLAGGAP